MGNVYCLNCFHSYRTKETHKKQEKVWRDHDYYYVQMSDNDKKILIYNPGEKSLKVLFIVYTDLE